MRLWASRLMSSARVRALLVGRIGGTRGRIAVVFGFLDLLGEFVGADVGVRWSFLASWAACSAAFWRALLGELDCLASPSSLLAV